MTPRIAVQVLPPSRSTLARRRRTFAAWALAVAAPFALLLVARFLESCHG